MIYAKIKAGSRWRYTQSSGQFFTRDKVYEALSDQDENGHFRIQDNRKDGRRHWTNDRDFYAHFERADGPVRTVARKEVVPGTYGVLEVAGTYQGNRACVRFRSAGSVADDPYIVGSSPDELRDAAQALLAIADALDPAP